MKLIRTIYVIGVWLVGFVIGFIATIFVGSAVFQLVKEIWG